MCAYVQRHPLPDALRPSALPAMRRSSGRVHQRAYTRSAHRRRGPCCPPWEQKCRSRPRSRARPRGGRYRAVLAGLHLRNPPWRLRGGQSRRRARRGPFARALAESDFRGVPRGQSVRTTIAEGQGAVLTSRRSSFVGMLHNSDLSSRPGRRRAESIRSGRLGMRIEVWK